VKIERRALQLVCLQILPSLVQLHRLLKARRQVRCGMYPYLTPISRSAKGVVAVPSHHQPHKAPEAQQPGGLTGILQAEDSSVVKLGDASVASPFTSKSDSIANSTVAFLQFNFPFFFNNHPRSYCYRATRALYISYNLADVQNPCAELPYPSVCSICSLSRWGEVS